MGEDEKEPDEPRSGLKEAVFDSIYGSLPELKASIRSSMVNDMRKNLLSVLGLVSFKLVTQIYAREGSYMIDNESERLYKSRQIKETIRSRVIDEWKTVGPADAKRRVKEHMEPGFVTALSDDLIEEITQEAVKEIDQWVRQALDMTPTAEDLFESLTLTPAPEPDDD